MKKRIGELLFQIILIMIGVFLGLFVSNWSSAKEQDSRKKVLIENLLNEVKGNYEKINKTISYHEALRDSTRHYLKHKKTNIPDFFKGLNTSTLTSSAFETGIQTGIINELSIEKIQSLNKVYAHQKSYTNFCNIVLSGIINKNISDDDQSIRNIIRFLYVSMTDISIKERDLLNSYEDLENILNTE